MFKLKNHACHSDELDQFVMEDCTKIVEDAWQTEVVSCDSEGLHY